MTPYINIHTHHLSKDNGVFLFNNRFGFDKDIYTQSFFSIGIHPWDTHLIKPNDLDELERLIKNENCIAIGECGLDKVCKSDVREQKYFFELQLQLALKYNKVVIIHCVKAYDELIGICKPYQQKIPLIIHGFNKTDVLAMQLINKGFYLSVSNSFLLRTKLPSSVLNNLFLETDDQENLSIIDVYDLASQKLSLDKVILKEKIYSNFVALFKVKIENE